MRAALLTCAAVAALGAVGPGQAQTPRDPSSTSIVEAGPRGGFYCISDDEVAETARGKYRSTLSGLGPTCTRIEPFRKLAAVGIRETPTAVVGVARIDGAGQVVFALWRANQ